jgi:outer membrane protein OmpA-like peptidoglycan-associated protein
MSRPAGGGSHTASSFTDLMASLLVVFVLLFVATLNEGKGKRDEIQDQLIKALRGQLQAAGLDTHWVNRDSRDKNTVVIVFPDSLLFKTAEWELQSSGRNTLRLAIPGLASVLCGDDMRPNIETVVIEGHTDTTYKNAPSLDDAKAKNLELSQARSMSVARESLASLSSEAARGCIRSLVSASGRGQEETLPGVRGDDARQRRVIFRIRVQTDLVKTLSALRAPAVDVSHPSGQP